SPATLLSTLRMANENPGKLRSPGQPTASVPTLAFFRELAFGKEIGQRDERKDEKRDANIEKRERHRGQVEEQRVEILELDAAMVVDHVRIVAVVLND